MKLKFKNRIVKAGVVIEYGNLDVFTRLPFCGRIIEVRPDGTIIVESYEGFAGLRGEPTIRETRLEEIRKVR